MQKETINRIFASYTDDTIRVYQAYGDAIADAAICFGYFAPPFRLTRMSWIKPSFLWMMYRCGWGEKEGQTRVLAVDMERSGFDDIVQKAVLSHFSAEIHGDYEEWRAKLATSDVRVQWDPDRNIHGAPQERRAIQLGLKGTALRNYAKKQIVKITDITEYVSKVKESIRNGTFEESMLPAEREYMSLPRPTSPQSVVGAEKNLLKRYQNLPDYMGVCELDALFTEFLKTAGTCECGLTEKLEALLELSDRQWHTYELLNQNTRNDIEAWLMNVLNFDSVEVTELIALTVGRLGLGKLYCIIKVALNDNLKKEVRQVIEQTVKELDGHAEDPFFGMR
jgi:hypothetical protein